jgi:cardiolipin synthase
MNEERSNGKETLIRLAKPMKKGFFRLIFSRFFLVVLLMLLEVLVFLSFYRWLSGYLTYLSAFLGVFTVIMVIYLFNSGMDSSARLTWMFLIALVPIPGAVLLWFTRNSFGHRLLSSRLRQMNEETAGCLAQDREVLKEIEASDPATAGLKRYLDKSGCFPVYGDTDVTYLPSGEAAFEAMIRELEKAESYIFMEYFIIEEGEMWSRILEILLRKVSEGVDVRVIYDGMCDMANLPVDYAKRLRERGIRAKKFAPLMPVVSSHYNYRDHRKILVIDGRTAFNGGVNLADEYINRRKRFGRWKDAAVMLKGGAAESFTLMFLQMWNTDEKEMDLSPLENIGDGARERAEGFVMPYSDSPLDSYKAGENVYMDILNRADDYVHIMTPYLILDDELETAIRFAAQRGVDVKIILPGIPDKKMAYALAKSHYKRLLDAGVGVYEYEPGFMHSKVFCCDGKKAVVGTINLDYRSLYHHFECATYLYGCPCIEDIEKDFGETLKRCKKVSGETMKKDPLFYRLVGPLIKFIAPLM